MAIDLQGQMQERKANSSAVNHYMITSTSSFNAGTTRNDTSWMSSPLETVEVRELKAEVFENERAVNAACKAVEDHIFCAIDEQFSKESISVWKIFYRTHN